jgi:hypothetical protein
MTPSNAKVLSADMRHSSCPDAVDVVSAETSDASNAQATHVTSTNVAHVASVKGTHAATTVASAKPTHTASPATPGLCSRGNKAAGQHCGCQNHHHSSSHDILHLVGRVCSATGIVRHWRDQLSGRQRLDAIEMRTLSRFLNSTFRSGHA